MIRKLNSDCIVSERVVEAQSILGRMRGMLGRTFNDFDAMLFRDNTSIHMFFMGIPLDIVFLNKEDKVVSIRKSLRPWRMAADFSAVHVIELPAGTIDKSGIAEGDTLEISVDATV